MSLYNLMSRELLHQVPVNSTSDGLGHSGRSLKRPADNAFTCEIRHTFSILHGEKPSEGLPYCSQP